MKVQALVTEFLNFARADRLRLTESRMADRCRFLSTAPDTNGRLWDVNLTAVPMCGTGATAEVVRWARDFPEVPLSDHGTDKADADAHSRILRWIL